MVVTFDSFAETSGPRLRHALVAAYGIEVGVDAAAEAMAYGFEHWNDVQEMGNPAGYLYRVGQSEATRLRRRPSRVPRVEAVVLPDIEPSLVPALEQLTEQQRIVVLLVTGLQWRRSEVADLLDLSHSTVRTHLRRGLDHLRSIMDGAPHA